MKMEGWRLIIPSILLICPPFVQNRKPENENIFICIYHRVLPFYFGVFFSKNNR